MDNLNRFAHAFAEDEPTHRMMRRRAQLTAATGRLSWIYFNTDDQALRTRVLNLAGRISDRLHALHDKIDARGIELRVVFTQNVEGVQ